MTEKELLIQINNNEADLKNSRLLVSDLRNKLAEAETNLIGLKLNADRLREQLKKFREAHFIPDPDPREADNARFANALPELLKKVK